MSEYYPIYLRIAGRKCLVVGGGEVAFRKVVSLLEHEAALKVVSPAFCPALKELAAVGRIKTICRPYRSGDLEGALLAVAATDDPAVNQSVSRDALAAGILVNVVDDAAQSSFIVPSNFQRGDLNIAISTSGRSPALARKLRHKLESEIGEEYGELAGLLDEVRREIKHGAARPDGEAWQKALDLDALLALIRRGEKEKARQAILQSLTILSKGV